MTLLNPLREQFLAFWKRQSRLQRGLLIALVVAGLAAIAAFLTWANTPTYAVAFSGLSEADAGVIVEKLTEAGVAYQLRDGGTILVPSDQVYEVRLSMARQGLPQNGTVGFELFSGTTLGMTEFTQRVNYQRALEGELERTIGSLTAVQGVRVHIVTPEKTLLTSDQLPTTASITLRFRPGQSLEAGQVRSITHLVAASVEGLKPENVVVLDVNGNLLASGSAETAEARAAAQSDDRRAAEAAQAAAIETKVRQLLDTVLGPNKSVVKASVTMDWTQRNITTQAIDPATTAVRSSQTLTETYNADGLAVGGVPGALANLPPLTSTTSISGTEGAYYWRQENTTNFEMTSVESHEVVAPGQIEQISLSVMVDGITETQRLESLRTVIAAAAGIQAARGDTLAVESLAFDRTYYEAQAAELQQQDQMELYFQIGLAVLAVLALIGLLWYVQRLLNNLRLASAEAWTPVLMPAAALAAGTPAAAPLGAGAATTPGAAAPLPAPPQTPAPPVTPEPVQLQPSPQDEQVERLIVRLAEENPTTVAEVIRMWLSEDEKK